MDEKISEFRYQLNIALMYQKAAQRQIQLLEGYRQDEYAKVENGGNVSRSFLELEKLLTDSIESNLMSYRELIMEIVNPK